MNFDYLQKLLIRIHNEYKKDNADIDTIGVLFELFAEEAGWIDDCACDAEILEYTSAKDYIQYINSL